MDFLQIDDKRRAKRLTVVQLCEKIGVNESTYYKWKENPGRMKADMLVKIANALDMTEQEKVDLF